MSGKTDAAPLYYGDHEDVSSEKHAMLAAVGKRIRTLRLKQGLTQSDLASHLAMNRGHLSEVEHGKTDARLITLQIIARGLGTSMAKLLKGL